LGGGIGRAPVIGDGEKVEFLTAQMCAVIDLISSAARAASAAALSRPSALAAMVDNRLALGRLQDCIPVCRIKNATSTLHFRCSLECRVFKER
jgi:hypothetical protein